MSKYLRITPDDRFAQNALYREFDNLKPTERSVQCRECERTLHIALCTNVKDIIQLNTI